MQNKYLNKLEYFKILENLKKFSKTYIGKELVENLRPTNSFNNASFLQEETNESCNLLTSLGNDPIFALDNIELYLKQLSSEFTLTPKALLEIARELKLSRELKEYFNSSDVPNSFPILSTKFEELYSNKSFEEKIFNSITSETTISDSASKNLSNIRRKLKSLELNIKDKLNSFIHSSTYSKYIQEAVVTIRNSRYVIPVKEEFRSQIKGFIHDMSSSGATVFIEPLSVFELNTEITNLKLEETLEIEKILKELSTALLPYNKDLCNTLNIIGYLDFVFAKAKYSKSLNAISPILNSTKIIDLKKARHPLLDEQIAVPIDINLGKDFSSLIITGPNTGGKTVALKTVGLLCLMASSGLHIPANENSTVFIFDNIFAVLGDEQSLQESLSTFSSHMLNIIDVLNTSTTNSLILLDEIGSGTDPIEGSCLAISILEHFHNLGALTFSTTHYPELKNYALVSEGFQNASCEFNLKTLKPTYKLLLGVPGKSNAFEISRQLGLSSDILSKAEFLMTTDNINIEELLKNIYDDKLKIEKEKEIIQKNSNQIELLRKQLEHDNTAVLEQEQEIIENAKLEARKILSSAKDEATKTIRNLKEIKNNINQDSLTDLNNIRNSINDSIKNTNISYTNSGTSNLTKEDILIGMEVLLLDLNQSGIVINLPNKDNQVQIQIGNTKMFVAINKLVKLNNKSIKKENHSHITNSSKTLNLKTKNATTKINVIGLNVNEAVYLIDKFLDDCSVSKIDKVQIVHGKGTGALRNGIHTFLKTHPHVKSYRVGTYGEGEMGVTIVELKK